jgi:hypothetical protein
MNENKNAKVLGGIAPFGYRWHKGILAVDETEAPVRRLIYELFLKHRRKKTVARILNDLGHRTRKGATFYDITVERLLRDATAKGTWLVNKREVEVEAIVSKDVWERANTILVGTKPAKQSVQLFTGIAYCECGGRMVVPSNTVKYVCIDCRHKIPCDDLETIFHSQLERYVGTESEGLFEHWRYVNLKGKRILVEQICDRIVVGKASIQIDFGYLPEGRLLQSAAEIEISVEGLAPPEKNIVTPTIDRPPLGQKEAAEFLNMSTMTLYRRRKAGKIGYFQDGLHIKYSKETHLLPYLAEREKKKA